MNAEYSSESTTSSQIECNRKYLFIFITNSKNGGHVKINDFSDQTKEQANDHWTLDLDYMMYDSYEIVDKLQFYIDSQFKISKLRLNVNDLEEYLNRFASSESNAYYSHFLDNEGSQQELITIYSEPMTKRIFVLAEFENEPFQLLQQHKQVVIGPLTIHYWLNGQLNQLVKVDLQKKFEELFLSPKPLFSLCMKDMLIYLSHSIPDEDLKRLKNKVEYMGGIVTEKIQVDVSVVVAEAVDEANVEAETESQQKPFSKFEDKQVYAAAYFGIPVVNPGWINSAWCHLQLQYKYASNKDFVMLKCFTNIQLEMKNIFKPFTIGVFPNIYENEVDKLNLYNFIINRINRAITSFNPLGTLVTGPLDIMFNKINLILHIKNSDINISELINKYENNQVCRQLMLNREWKKDPLPIVNIDWFIDSIINGEAQPLDRYKIN